jgi:SAM-dependent methyltransferase
MEKGKDKGSTRRFGYEWEKYDKIVPLFEEQFLRWIYPLKKEDFKGKRILDCGCGTGRNSHWPLIYGAKKVVCFDFDMKTVESAKRNLRDFKNAKVFYGSIYNIPYENEFDVSFSIGVIHHLEVPKKAIKEMVKATKKNGIVLMWVYGYEGNERILKFLLPLRKITSRLPVSIVHLISFPLSIPLFFFVKIFKQKNEYLRLLGGFDFRHLHMIIFDQLIPKIANYWKREEVMDLFKGQEIKNIRVYRVNEKSWTVIGKKI